MGIAIFVNEEVSHGMKISIIFTFNASRYFDLFLISICIFYKMCMNNVVQQN